MSQKIIVRICTGTTCYVLGGAQLLALEDELPTDVRARVSIEGALCFQLCKEDECRKAPFAWVNEILISEATVPKIIAEIQRQL